MNDKTKAILKEWVLPIALIGILWVTGLHKPVISFMQRIVLATGIIKPDTEADGPVSSTDYQWELTSPDGQPVSFDSFRGKVVFLNFFATWCPPCIAEMPGIQNLYEDTHSGDIEFIILSRDESHQKAIDFMEAKGYSVPLYFSASTVPGEFVSSVIPSTFIIDKKGNIVSQHHGMADYDNRKVRDFLKRLAAE